MGQDATQAFGHTVTSESLCAQIHIRSFFHLLVSLIKGITSA